MASSSSDSEFFDDNPVPVKPLRIEITSPDDSEEETVDDPTPPPEEEDISQFKVMNG